MYLYLLYFESSKLNSIPKLLGIFSNVENVQKTCELHAKVFNTNNGKPLDFTISRVHTNVKHGRYFCMGELLNQIPSYGMMTN